jgi:arylsulfatase A-like enzyme
MTLLDAGLSRDNTPAAMLPIPFLRAVLLFLLTASAAFSADPAASAAANQRKPNFIIILADDLGYGDLGCYGHPSIRTPNLDRMAAEGVRFTDFYVAAEVCTPSRAALLTGRYPIRSGMTHNQFRVLRRESMGHLPDDEITIASLLKKQGYATGAVGKWHLGNWMNNPAGHPMKHGFDSYFGLPHSNDMNPVAGGPKGNSNSLDPDPKAWEAPLFDGEKLIEQPTDQTQLTRRYAEKSVEFIKAHKAEPFFLYFASTFPHTPLFASEKFKDKTPRGRYGDVVEELDWAAGRILDTLRAEGLDKNTFVFFTSDNGPWLIRGLAGGSAGLLRDGKGSTWEGGMREPGIAWWPGKIPAGKVCHEIATTMDLLPTIAHFAGMEAPKDREMDGVDIAPILLNPNADGIIVNESRFKKEPTNKSDGEGRLTTTFFDDRPKREVFCYYRGTELFAARLGPWKAHFITQPGYGPGKQEPHDPPLLFNLEADPGESYECSADHPDIIAKIKAAVEKHRATVKPVKNQLVETVAK